MGTTVYPAKVNLMAALEAWTWPIGKPSLQWEFEETGSGHDLEVIFFGEEESTGDFRVLGASRLDETYALRVVIDVSQYGDSAQATEQRVWQLHDEVLALLRSDMTIGGAINHITGFRVRRGSALGPEYRRGQIVIDVSCVGFITF